MHVRINRTWLFLNSKAQPHATSKAGALRPRRVFALHMNGSVSYLQFQAKHFMNVYVYRYQVIGNNCQDWVEWLLYELEPELGRALFARGVRKVSETFLGQLAKRNKSLSEMLPTSLGSSSIRSSVPRQTRSHFSILNNIAPPLLHHPHRT
jgi:hypothetical protein